MGKFTLPKGRYLKTKIWFKWSYIDLSKNNFQKPIKRVFWPWNLERVEMTLLEGQILTKTFYFIGRMSIFRADNTQKSRSFKAKNNAQTTFG